MFQRRAVQKLHHEKGLAALLANVVNRADIRMVQRRRCLRLATEPLQRLPILRQILRQKLQRDKAPEPSVFRLVDDTHAPTAKFRNDAVMRDGLPDHWRESYV